MKRSSHFWKEKYTWEPLQNMPWRTMAQILPVQQLIFYLKARIALPRQKYFETYINLMSKLWSSLIYQQPRFAGSSLFRLFVRMLDLGHRFNSQKCSIAWENIKSNEYPSRRVSNKEELSSEVRSGRYMREKEVVLCRG